MRDTGASSVASGGEAVPASSPGMLFFLPALLNLIVFVVVRTKHTDQLPTPTSVIGGFECAYHRFKRLHGMYLKLPLNCRLQIVFH